MVRDIRSMGTLQQAHLEHNKIYAALYTNNPGYDWHWAIYFHHNHLDAKGRPVPGYKLHATNRFGPWQFECADQDLLTSSTLITVARIGSVADSTWGVEFLLEYLRNIPMRVPAADQEHEREFSCRLWFREAIRILNYAQVFVRCPDVNKLERELSSQTRLAEAAAMRDQSIAFETASPVFISKNAGAWSSD